MLTRGRACRIFHVMFKIFEKLGGVEPTLDVIQRRRKCKRLSQRAIEDWRSRRAIPPINVIALMAECEDRGIPFDLSDCRLPTDAPPRRGRPPQRATA